MCLESVPPLTNKQKLTNISRALRQLNAQYKENERQYKARKIIIINQIEELLNVRDSISSELKGD